MTCPPLSHLVNSSPLANKVTYSTARNTSETSGERRDAEEVLRADALALHRQGSQPAAQQQHEVHEEWNEVGQEHLELRQAHRFQRHHPEPEVHLEQEIGGQQRQVSDTDACQSDQQRRNHVGVKRCARRSQQVCEHDGDHPIQQGPDQDLVGDGLRKHPRGRQPTRAPGHEGIEAEHGNRSRANQSQPPEVAADRRGRPPAHGRCGRNTACSSSLKAPSMTVTQPMRATSVPNSLRGQIRPRAGHPAARYVPLSGLAPCLSFVCCLSMYHRCPLLILLTSLSGCDRECIGEGREREEMKREERREREKREREDKIGRKRSDRTKQKAPCSNAKIPMRNSHKEL